MQVIVGFILTIILVIAIILFVKNQGSYTQTHERDFLDIDYLLTKCHTIITEQCAYDTRYINLESLMTGAINQNAEAMQIILEDLNKNRQRCRYGDPIAKNFMKTIIRGIVEQEVNQDNMYDIIPDVFNKTNEELEYENMNYVWELFVYYMTVKCKSRVKGQLFKYLQRVHKWFTPTRKLIAMEEKDKQRLLKESPDDLVYVNKCEITTRDFLAVLRSEIEAPIQQEDKESKFIGFDEDADDDKFLAEEEETNSEDDEEDTKLKTRETRTESAVSPLNLNDYINIITQILYSKLYGYDILDTLTDLDMSEFEAGVSGKNTKLYTEYEGQFTDLHSVWVIRSRVPVHLLFLGFDKEEKLASVVRHLGEKENTIDLTESNPTKSVEDARGRRVTVTRPSAADKPSVCYRVSNVDYMSHMSVMNQHSLDGREVLKNWRLVDRFDYFAMNGCLSQTFSGDQGAGKTTHMQADLEIAPWLNLRIIEEVPELHINDLYPDRNVISLVTTEYRSFKDLLAHIRKQSGDLTMIGEITKKIQAAQVIEAATFGSKNVMLTNHAQTVDAFVTWASEALMMELGTSDRRAAVNEVVGVMRIFMHHTTWNSELYTDLENGHDFRGLGIGYVIDSISSIFPIEDKKFPATDDNFTEVQAINRLTEVFKESFRRQQEALYGTYEMIIFDPYTGSYVPKKWFSSYDLKCLKKNLSVEQIKMLQEYKDEWFGGNGSDVWIGGDGVDISEVMV